MTCRIEPARPEDAWAIVVVHDAAIRGSAADVYPVDVIAAWAPAPITPERVDDLARRLASGRETAIVARSPTGEVVGFGSIVAHRSELRALYVDPGHGRRGLGAALLARLEAMARGIGLSELAMDASLNAVGFYERHGFTARGRPSHRLPSGAEMLSVRMGKTLGAACPPADHPSRS